MEESVAAACAGEMEADERHAETAWIAAETVTEAGVATSAIEDCVRVSLSSGQDSSSHRGATADLTTATHSAATKRRQAPEKKNSRAASKREVQLTTVRERVTNDVSCQSRQKNASRRERKATKTLAIVLGTLTY